jgi:hypothetical protein
MSGFKNTIAARYISAKYENPSITALEALRDDAITECRRIEAEKSDVYTRYKGVHGRFQQSQLDVLDIQQEKILAVIKNVRKMIAQFVPA